MRDWLVYGRNPANGKSGKEKQQISLPKKFYLAEQLLRERFCLTTLCESICSKQWSVALSL